MQKNNFRHISAESNTTSGNVPSFGNAAIPLLLNGKRPKYLRVSVFLGDVSNVLFVTPKNNITPGSAATGLPLSLQSTTNVILNVHGFTRIAFDQRGSGNSSISLVPLSDF